MDPVGVARILLRHGANPKVKDVAGKTVVHWGAGCFCTPDTRKITGWCIEAAKSCDHFGEQVTLKGLIDLSSARYNGRTGILGGYDVDSKQRFVHVHMEETGEEKELLVKTRYLFVEDQCIYRRHYNLVDVQDRLLSVALHELVMGGDPETARFLCHEHNANVDVKELCGLTPRWMSYRPMLHGWKPKPSSSFSGTAATSKSRSRIEPGVI